jgi:hypothetical protein
MSPQGVSRGPLDESDVVGTVAKVTSADASRIAPLRGRSSRAVRRHWSLVASVGLAVSLLLVSCSSPQAVELPEPPAPLAPSTAPEADEGELAEALDFSLRRLLAGDRPDGFLAGDRLLVVTPETFAEVGVSADLLRAQVSFGGGCPGICTTSVEEVLSTLADDLGDPVVLDVPVPESLATWRSVSFQQGERSWRVSLGSDRRSLVAIEYFGPTPLG